jgi:hypothetical protein
MEIHIINFLKKGHPADVNLLLWRKPSSGMLRRVALVRTDVSKEIIASNISVTRINVLETALAVTSNRRTLRRNAIHCHHDDGGNTFLRNVGFYNSHTAWHPKIRHSSVPFLYFFSTKKVIELHMINLQKEKMHPKQTNKQTPWPLVRKRSIPNDRSPLVDEI